MMLPDQSTHIVLTAKLENEKVRVMIDSRANRSYASTRLGNKLAQFRYKKEQPYPLTMANRSLVDHGRG